VIKGCLSLMESVDSYACGFRECRHKVPETRHQASHGAEDASQWSNSNNRAIECSPVADIESRKGKMSRPGSDFGRKG
jgi:hypothetical protein